MRALTAAALQVQPRSTPLTRDSATANVAHCVDWLRRCVEAARPDLVVLPETCTTGFSPGLSGSELADVVDEIPGPLTAPLDAAAAELGIHLVYGAYERGPEPGVVFNTAVLAGPDGDVLGRYRKTHPYCTELVSGGGWVTPGDEACVVETTLGAIGLVICFDGDFPELSRVCALLGAEILARPSALLRSADIWELTNRARAYDNHVYVVASNATGIDPAGTLYFGNSMIVTPVADVVARGSSYEQWVSASLDPQTAMSSLTPGSSVPQGFDHLADRNLALLEKYRDVLAGPGATRFPYRRAALPGE
jgi:deaminated glutathione amidase